MLAALLPVIVLMSLAMAILLPMKHGDHHGCAVHVDVLWVRQAQPSRASRLPSARFRARAQASEAVSRSWLG